MRPAFLITIDTEGDNLWAKPHEITTKNAAFLPRFQELCEKYDFKPTYLTNYEMATDKSFVQFALNLISQDKAEIGMHLHAWNSPPIHSLTSDDYSFHPYLVEYPESEMRLKIKYLTELLEETFSRKMVSHRAGRWAFDSRYAKILAEFGYKVDCSVTPSISWTSTKGTPKGNGGTDYRDFPDTQYLVDLNDIGRPGTSSLWEIPVTIMDSLGPRYAVFLRSIKGVRRLVNRRWPEKAWLRPNGFNIKSMILIVNMAVEQGRPYIQFMLHSSEFMPGGSPNFPDKASVEKLYQDLEKLFLTITKNGFIGMTLESYCERRLISEEMLSRGCAIESA